MPQRKLYLNKSLLWLILFGLATAFGRPARAAAQVDTITIKGVIDPSMADYLERAVDQATGDQAQCLIIRLNTLGGLGTSMDKMVDLLLNSKVPTVVYVSPRGAEAASAGTFITLAADFAVMHPNSTIGAAHPRELFSMPQPPQPAEENGKKPQPSQVDAVMEKTVNFYATKARTIAEARGRNAAWAEAAVRKSATVTAAQALKLNVVNSLQPDMGSLLAWLEGKTTKIEGKTVVLHTRGAKVVEIPASIKDRFLHQLADPNLLLILIVLAAMGILFELQNPGAIFPGVVGGISLLLALYSMSVLPVTTAGLALIVFGLLLLILEVKLPTHGILTIGGIACFIIGGLMLVDTRYSWVGRMSWQIVVAMAVLVGGFFAVAIGAAIKAHLRKPTTGKEGMLGAMGKVTAALSEDEEGEVAVAGELWRARSKQGNIAPGEKVEVVGLEGLTLIVRSANKE